MTIWSLELTLWIVLAFLQFDYKGKFKGYLGNDIYFKMEDFVSSPKRMMFACGLFTELMPCWLVQKHL